jgi:uncharacterized paraquat-inducible protein A
MRPRVRSYRCTVCSWQGRQEPVDAGDAAPCPRCGVFLYPLSWAQTWGLALLVMVGTAAVVVALAAAM